MPEEQRWGLCSLASQESPSPRMPSRQESDVQMTPSRELMEPMEITTYCNSKDECLSPDFWSHSFFLCVPEILTFLTTQRKKKVALLWKWSSSGQNLNHQNIIEKLSGTTIVSPTSISLDESFNVLLPVNFRATKLSCPLSNYFSLLLHFFSHPLQPSQHSHCMLLAHISNTCCCLLLVTAMNCYAAANLNGPLDISLLNT